jgi:hypothetical protein
VPRLDEVAHAIEGIGNLECPDHERRFGFPDVDECHIHLGAQQLRRRLLGGVLHHARAEEQPPDADDGEHHREWDHALPADEPGVSVARPAIPVGTSDRHCRLGTR